MDCSLPDSSVHGIFQARVLEWVAIAFSRETPTPVLLITPKPLTADHNKLWKILQEMGIPDHLTCLLRNLYAGQEATVRTGHGTTDWFQITWDSDPAKILLGTQTQPKLCLGLEPTWLGLKPS